MEIESAVLERKRAQNARWNGASKAKRYGLALLERAGIRVDGPEPWDIQVRDERVYWRVLREGTLGLGESYMDGWWDCDRLDEFFARMLRAGIDGSAVPVGTILPQLLSGFLLNRQLPLRARRAVAHHYDAGNDLFEAMLDGRMIYSCAWWKDARTLDEAQEAKLDLICRKLDLGPDQKVLDIGCGWGGFARFAAERYGANVVGITLSAEQAKLAAENCAGLPVEIRVQDYRHVRGEFDRLVSIGMLEHVGHKNYRTFMEVVRSRLHPEGLALVQSIGGTRSVAAVDPWLDKYIFPDSVVPSVRQLGAAMEGQLVMEDWQNFGADYDRTMMAWFANVDGAWDRLPRYGQRFRRMWRYYLLQSAGAFRARKNQLWQIVLSSRGVPGRYQTIC